MSKLPIPISRRQFVRLALAGTVTTLLEVACQGSPSSGVITPSASPLLEVTTTATPRPTPTPRAAVTATPRPASTTPVLSPTPTAATTFPLLPGDTPEIISTRNDPHYNVRFIKTFSPLDHDTWQLKVSGLIQERVNFNLDDLLSWPQLEQISRMKCVECWSYKAKWEGFSYATLAERVNPSPEATHLRFDCVDDYWEIASIEELSDPRVVFVLRMNDDLLLDEYGAPLRLMFPAKYGYKSAKTITAITFTDRDGAGYWPTVGPYTGHGDIQPGVDFPQDLPGERKQIAGGEITDY